LGPERAEMLGLTEPAGVAGGPAAVATLEPPYKAGRASKGVEFYSDLSNLQRLLGVMSVTPLCRPWLEADDLAGLLVQQAVRKGMAVRILSGDRDLMQLVSDPWDVAMLYPAKSLPKSPYSMPPSTSPSGATSLSAATAAAASEGLAGTTPPPRRSRLRGISLAADFPFVKLRDADVVSALGVAPALVPDYKALTGDASDRLPGVAGIGPKTAVELLTLYGNLAGVHCAAAVRTSKLSSKRRSALQVHVCGRNLCCTCCHCGSTQCGHHLAALSSGDGPASLRPCMTDPMHRPGTRVRVYCLCVLNLCAPIWVPESGRGPSFVHRVLPPSPPCAPPFPPFPLPRTSVRTRCPPPCTH
ncbi:hypothetical protein VaNZ11_001903, partial [Volvox africanus]